MGGREYGHTRRLAGGAGDAAVAAREEYLKVLKDKKGDWRNDEVMKALEALEAANPTADPALSGTFLDDNWLQVSAPDYNYAGKKGSQDATLGALSFNMYEPRDAQVRVDKTTQVVAPLDDEDDTRRWDITLLVTFIDERYPEFKAKITSFGRIQPDKDDEGKDCRLQVKFIGGELMLDDGCKDMLDEWKETMGVAQKGKDNGFDLQEAIKGAVLKFGMGFEGPNGVADDGRITWSMKRPPQGFTDLLYLDDKLRVTRGNAGSIVAAVRAK